MKLSCLPFKTSSIFNLTASLLLLSLSLSCYRVSLLPQPPMLPRQGSFPTVRFADEHGVVVARAAELSCDTLSPLRLQIKLYGLPQVLTPSFVVRADNTWHVEIDALVLTSAHDLRPDYLQLRRTLCRAIAPRGRLFYGTADRELLSTLASWLQVLSPPCHIKFRPTHGFHCELRAPASQPERETLARIKRRMVNTWQRQPYLLTRRLAVAIDLAHILTDGEAQHFTRFCHILRNSFVRELPLSFTSKRWQLSVCDTRDEEARLKHAALGLELAVREITLFKQLFERASHRGNVAVRISAGERPGKRFWLELMPEKDVISGVEQSYQTILETRAPSGCWHPLLIDSMPLARAIGLVDACGNYPSFVTDAQVADYFIDSITSEMVFAISNGRTKFLRLPSGNYRYRISHMPNYYLPSSTTEVAHGNLQWQKHSRPLISRWQPSP